MRLDYDLNLDDCDSVDFVESYFNNYDTATDVELSSYIEEILDDSYTEYVEDTIHGFLQGNWRKFHFTIPKDMSYDWLFAEVV